MDTKLATIQICTKQWASIIQDCRSSGLKVDDYCQQHSLSRNAIITGSVKSKKPPSAMPALWRDREIL